MNHSYNHAEAMSSIHNNLNTREKQLTQSPEEIRSYNLLLHNQMALCHPLIGSHHACQAYISSLHKTISNQETKLQALLRRETPPKKPLFTR